MREMKPGQPIEWRDISDRGPIYKSDWAVKNPRSKKRRAGTSLGVGRRKEKTKQIVIPCSKVKEVLAEIDGGTSGGRLWANRNVHKVRQFYY